MGDDRFCYLHVADALAPHLLDEEDEQLGWELPDDDVTVPQHLLPAYQDELDETVLPSASHPSYPCGNPYTTRPLSASTPSTSTSHHHQPPTLFHHPTSTHSTSLATTLPTLQLRQLLQHTAFGEPRERVWAELGLGEVLGGGKRRKLEFEREGEDEGQGAGLGPVGGGQGQAQGEAEAPAGQNAGDHPDDEMGDEEEE